MSDFDGRGPRARSPRPKGPGMGMGRGGCIISRGEKSKTIEYRK